MDGPRLILKEAVGSVFPGCQAWVRHRGEVLLDVAMGHTAREPEAVTVGTRFDLASLTKAVGTTVVVMRLYAEGVLDLNQRVVRSLGRLPRPAFLRQASWADLLGHRSGLQGYAELFRHFDPEDPPLPSQARIALAKRISDLPRAYPTGTRSEYSDFGFMFLGWALERRAGLPLAALIQSQVISPLGLDGMAFPATGEAAVARAAATERCPWRGRLLRGEVHDEHAWLLGGLAGHAGLFGTARDVGKVGTALLDAFAGRRDDFLPAEVVRRFWDPRGQLPGSTWRLGFDGASASGSTAGDRVGPWTVGHLGFTGTSLWIYPEQELAVVLLTNRVHPSRESEGIAELRRAFHVAVAEAIDSDQLCLL